MKRKTSALSFALCLALTSPPLIAQLDQLTNVFRLDDVGNESRQPDVAAGAGGQFVVVWRESPGGSEGVSGRRVDAAGNLIGSQLVLKSPEAATEITRPSVSADGQGRFVVVWGESRPSQSCVAGSRFQADGSFLSSVSVDACSALPGRPAVSVDSAPAGDFAVAWQEQTGAPSNETEVFLRTFTPTGQPRRDPGLVTDLSAPQSPPAVAVSDAGEPVVAWEEALSGSQIVVHRFDRSGLPRGGPIAASSALSAAHPKIAAGASGNFGVVWEDGAGITARLFDPTGNAFATLLPRIGDPTPDAALDPDIAMDSRGNVVLAWSIDGFQEEGTFVTAQVYNHRGTQQSERIFIELDPASSHTSPSVALQEDGTFLVAWESRPPGGPSRILGVLFANRSEDDLCVYRGNEFRCGTIGGANNSLLNESIRFGNGLAQGDVPFFADINGDGDDDPCVRRGSTFLCDTLHNGGAPEVAIAFGSPEHIPLFGNLDGDEDDDPCVRRGRTFLCDTAHNGGGAEIRIIFGLASDVPVLGDVNGDGFDDPCVFRPSVSRFLCDTDHNGQRDLVQDVDAQPGDRPLLGDPFGAGADTFCVARGRRLLCSFGSATLTEVSIASRTNDTVLLGNIDGF